MEATASTRSPSTWNSRAQNSALATRKLRTSVRPKLNTSVPQSGRSPPRGVGCSGRGAPAERARARGPRPPGAAPGGPPGAPVRRLAAAGVGVLVQGGPVEAAEGPLVLGEVRRHPVDDDADPGLVRPVDEVAEVVGAAEPRGRGEVAGDLVAPGAAERVLGHRQELQVGEARGDGVVDELAGQLPAGQTLPPGATARPAE